MGMLLVSPNIFTETDSNVIQLVTAVQWLVEADTDNRLKSNEPHPLITE